jgi:hypothetical protein
MIVCLRAWSFHFFPKIDTQMRLIFWLWWVWAFQR